MADKCPICNSDVNKPTYYDNHGTSMHFYSCPRCGEFHLPYHFSRELPYLLNNDIHKIAVLSHWVRTRYEAIAKEPPDKNFNIKCVTLDEQLVNSIIKNPLPTPAEQANRFVLWLGNKAPGENIESLYLKDLLSLIGSATPEELRISLDYLIREGLVQGKTMKTGPGPMGVDIALSFEGWEYYEKLKRGTIDSRKAFMAMKYRDAQLDAIVENTFKPAVKQTGFDLVRLDDRPKAGLIDDRLRVEIQTSRFLIADLSDDNLGAYWEAGYAEGLGKPVIYTCEKTKFENPDSKPHFDTNHHLTIPWDSNNLQEAANQLKATIRATLPEVAKLTDD
jgi:hypothetical protein